MPEPAKKNRLRAMKLEEISLVDHPANPDAHVVLFKRDSEQVEKDGVECPECKAKLKDKFALNKHMMKEHPEKAPAKKARDPNDGDFVPLADQTSARRFLEAVSKMLGIQKDDDAENDADGDSTDDATDFDDAYRQQQAYRIAGEVYDRADALVDALRDHFENGADPDALGGVVDQFGDSLKGSLSDLAKADSEALEKAGKKISADRLKRLKNAHEALANIISEAEGPEAQKPASKKQEEGDNVDKTKLDTEVREHVEDLEKKLADAERERDEAKAGNEETPEQDVLKSLPEDLRKRFEAQEAEIQKMRDERETAVYVEKAKGYAHVAGDADELGGAMKRIAKGESGEDDLAVIEARFKALEEMAKQANFYGEFGKSGALSSGSTAMDQIKAEAEAIRKSDPSLTTEQAEDRAVQRNPALAEQYRAELRSGLA